MGVPSLLRSRSEPSWDARRTRGLLILLALMGITGCQGIHPIESRRLIEHQALIDFSGLGPAAALDDIKARGAAPESWEALPAQGTAMYTHRQWRSPSTHTGVGAAYIHLPLPIGAGTVLWFAQGEYSKKNDDGKIIAQWVDDLGRHWFEAENNKYHVRGYCLAQGFEAWIIYFGYKTQRPPNPGEISLAARCADTFVPLVGGVPLPAHAPTSNPAATPTTRPPIPVVP